MLNTGMAVVMVWLLCSDICSCVIKMPGYQLLDSGVCMPYQIKTVT